MAKIVIIGAGAMGTAIAVPALDNGHEVLLVGSPLDDAIISAMNVGKAHPKLDAPLEGDVSYLFQDQLTGDDLATAVNEAGGPRGV